MMDVCNVCLDRMKSLQAQIRATSVRATSTVIAIAGQTQSIEACFELHGQEYIALIEPSAAGPALTWMMPVHASHGEHPIAPHFLERLVRIERDCIRILDGVGETSGVRLRMRPSNLEPWEFERERPEVARHVCAIWQTAMIEGEE